MPLAVPISIALGRFKRLPQRTAEVWEGGIVPFPMWADGGDPGAPPVRVTGVIWVSRRTGLLHLDLPQAGEPATPDLALATLLEFGVKQAKNLEGRPSRVEVRDPALRDALAGSLAALETGVTVVDDLPAVREALRGLEAATYEGRLPGLLESPGMSVERLRAFADAAARFHAARPWDRLTNDDLIVVESQRAPRDRRHACVLGQGGEEFGLAFYPSRRAYERAIEGDATSANGVTFDTIDALPFGDVDAWQEHALPVAGQDAYPLAADLRLDGPGRRPDAKVLTYTEGMLRALAETTDDELDRGAWQKQVDTFDGPLTLRLSLPYLLEAEAPRSRRRRGPGGVGPLPFAERANAQIGRLIQGKAFGSLDDVNAELQRLFAHGPLELDALPDRELSPLERAQELAYDAMEARGRLRIKRARQALAISEDCADAWVLLGNAAPTPEAALTHYGRAMQAAVAALGGAERFESMRGEFWGHLETRPYMRARLGMAQALVELDRVDEAIAHFQALLELNPEDNQGIRYLLLVALLERGRDDEAGKLLARYHDDVEALWRYGRLLWCFRTGGESPATRDALVDAAAANPHALEYLLDPEAMPFAPPAAFTLASREEGVYVADKLGPAFAMTGGAFEWLRACARPRGARHGSSRHRGGRR